MSEVKSRKRTKVIAKPPIPASQTTDAEETKNNKQAERAYARNQDFQRKNRVWARVALIVGVMVVGYFMRTNEKPFAQFKEHHPFRMQKLECSDRKEDKFVGCTPEECGRIVSDTLMPVDGANTIRHWALTFFKYQERRKVLGTCRLICK